jgi:transposase
VWRLGGCGRDRLLIFVVSDDVLTDELWARLAPLIPPRTRRFRYPGRLACDDRAVLAGILWVLRYDVPWRQLPATFGVSGVTCWRRLRDWQTAGVWQALHEALLAELNAAGLLDLHVALVDSSHVHALKGGKPPGRARSTAPTPAPNTT